MGPLQPEDLRKALCRALRCQPGELQLLEGDGGDVVADLDSNGFMSTCGTLAVSVQVRGREMRLHLFVKAEDRDVSDFIGGMRAFEREADFYGKIVPHLERAWRPEPADVEQVRCDCYRMLLSVHSSGKVYSIIVRLRMKCNL